MYIVYALVDPRNYKIRYIGLTKSGYHRFYQHVKMHDKGQKKKNAWISEFESDWFSSVH